MTVRRYDPGLYEKTHREAPEYTQASRRPAARRGIDRLSSEEFDIQTAGFTKCRFPVLAKRYVIRNGEVLHTDLSSLESIDV